MERGTGSRVTRNLWKFRARSSLWRLWEFLNYVLDRLLRPHVVVDGAATAPLRGLGEKPDQDRKREVERDRGAYAGAPETRPGPVTSWFVSSKTRPYPKTIALVEGARLSVAACLRYSHMPSFWMGAWLAMVAASDPSTSVAAPVRVAAASDLRFALSEILADFKTANPGLRVEATYGSSGNFFAQIREGAPYDLFLSADVEYANRLAAAGLGDAPFHYATGRLALVVRRDSGLDPSGLGTVLLQVPVRRVAIANPAHAPYGRSAVATLRTWGVYDSVAPRLVLGDSVSQATQFVDSGAAEAGVVALSLARAAEPRLRYAEIPETAHPQIEQAGLILKRTTSPLAARALRDFLLGDLARRVLERCGFGLPRR